jgi:tetratricopeptide (TPR) repeat protein
MLESVLQTTHASLPGGVGMHLADVAVKCPHCGLRFNSKQLPLFIETGQRNSELRQDFGGLLPQPEQYIVCTCPSCGNADWMKNFPASKQELSGEAPVLLPQRNAPAHLQFRDAAVLSERNGRNLYNIGFLYLYAAWCADDSGAFPQANGYRRLAADAFAKSILTSSCPPERLGETEYLIGELLRRSGDFQAARDHFTRVIVKLPAQFALMARKLMRLADQQNSNAIPFVFEAKN